MIILSTYTAASPVYALTHATADTNTCFAPILLCLVVCKLYDTTALLSTTIPVAVHVYLIVWTV